MANAAKSPEIIAHLSSKSLHPTQAWLSNFLQSQKLNVPLPALKQTAFFRLIHSDFTVSLSAPPSGILPTDILDATIQERKLRGPIPVQILDVEDLGKSRWSQVEAIEADERGETTRGREIIRVVAQEEGEGEQGINNNQSSGVGPHKILLQDCTGQTVYGLELFPVQGINLEMAIGSKLVLKDVSVARGVLLLEPKSVTVFGGKIEELNAQWKAGRREALKAAVKNHLDTT